MIETERSERDRDEEKRGKIARKKETDRASSRGRKREKEMRKRLTKVIIFPT